MGAVEDTDCISTEGLYTYPNKCPGYGIKQSSNPRALR